MVFKKKEKKENVLTFGTDGVPERVPELDIPVEYDVPSPLPEQNSCVICGGEEYYKDGSGLWHKCPKCTEKKKVKK